MCGNRYRLGSEATSDLGLYCLLRLSCGKHGTIFRATSVWYEKLCYNFSIFIKFEPGHSISCKIACAPSQDSAQADQSLSCPPEDAFDYWLSKNCTVKTDQTVRMRRLIWIVAGHTCVPAYLIYVPNGFPAVPWISQHQNTYQCPDII